MGSPSNSTSTASSTASWRCELVAHRTAPANLSLRVDGTVTVRAAALVIAFELRGDVDRIALPARSASPARRDRLWEHTCFEAFLATSRGDSYLELNLSASGDWALWRFDGYRDGMRAASIESAPELRTERAPSPEAAPAKESGHLRMTASLGLDDLTAELGAEPSIVGLAAVIEERAGNTSYWACRHPADRPDFHRRAGWTIAVYPPSSACEGRAR